ncbi:MAG: hypothetical protein JWO06_3329 [Bacteroidota bacterium]|nr:hypothetical protein [Bacteroidota bacterium]
MNFISRPLVLTISFLFIGAGKPLLTTKLGGSYGFGMDIEKGRIGWIDVYPDTDSTVLFNLSLNRGAPSYNMGEVTGRLLLKGDSATFYSGIDGDSSCRLIFTFGKREVSIKTINDKDKCGFGASVFADGIYKKRGEQIPQYFIKLEGDTVYFKRGSNRLKF